MKTDFTYELVNAVGVYGALFLVIVGAILSAALVIFFAKKLLALPAATPSQTNSYLKESDVNSTLNYTDAAKLVAAIRSHENPAAQAAAIQLRDKWLLEVEAGTLTMTEDVKLLIESA